MPQILVKCRKKGAANWGNSTKKEEFLALPEFSQLQIDAMRKNGIEVEVVDEGQKCWKGYEKKGTKKMFGKTYNNCVKKEEVEKNIGVPREYDKALMNMLEDPRTTWYEEER